MLEFPTSETSVGCLANQAQSSLSAAALTAHGFAVDQVAQYIELFHTKRKMAATMASKNYL